MRQSMPSPHGTNHAGLFLGDNPRAAYDEAMPDDAAAALLEFLRDKLSPEDLAAFSKMLGADPDAAMDSPEPFQGMPQPGGKLFGQDAAMRAQIKRIEMNMARITVSR